LDFSGIQGYPNNYQDWREELPRFHGLSDSPLSHISSFIDVISKLNINHEDVKMKMFILSLDFLEDEIMDWYGKLGEGKISSLSDFFKIFLESWSPLHEKVKCERVVIDVEYSFPCVLESLHMTHECPHPPCLPLTYECSPSLPLTKRSMGSQPFPCRSQLEPPSQPFSSMILQVNSMG
jgi:hypothetical protein